MSESTRTPTGVRPRLNTTVPQFSPATPSRDPVPFGAPLNRAQISEPLACSTRRIEYLKARAVFEQRQDSRLNNNRAVAEFGPETNSDTITSDFVSEQHASDMETPITRHKPRLLLRKRDYGRELEDRVRGLRGAFGDGDCKQVGPRESEPTENDTPTRPTEDFGNGPIENALNDISICEDNASYYTEVSSIVPAELDRTNLTLKTNKEIRRELLERVDHLKTTVHLDCDLLGFYRSRLVMNGSVEELQANRDLLVHLEEYSALRRELRRVDDYIDIKVLHPLARRNVFYNLDLLSIRLKLNRNYYMKAVDESTSYAFVALVKCGPIIGFSRPALVHEHGSIRLATLSFNEPIRLENLPIDFRAHVEIYSVKIVERPDPPSDCLFACGKKKIKDLDRDLHRRQISNHPNWLEPEFQKCGWVVLTSEMTGKNRYLMHDVEYPLEGTVELKVDCSTLPPALEDPMSSYLKVHQTRRNRCPEWVQFYVELHRGVLNFHRTETDIVNNRRPFAVLSVSDICSREVTEDRDKWTSEIFVFYFDYVSTSGTDKIISRRILLGADSEEKCVEWKCRLNNIIQLLNGN